MDGMDWMDGMDPEGEALPVLRAGWFVSSPPLASLTTGEARSGRAKRDSCGGWQQRPDVGLRPSVSFLLSPLSYLSAPSISTFSTA
jgi:hypothetical protein